MSFIKDRIKPFRHALDGVVSATMEEWPFKVHWACAIAVSIAGFYFGVSRGEWCIIALCCGMVIAAEMINTAIERLCDAVMPEQNPHIKFVKDASAGAVLIASAAAGISGLIIFYPYVIKMFG
jgi:diacylglycerol kinase (ATP)